MLNRFSKTLLFMLAYLPVFIIFAMNVYLFSNIHFFLYVVYGIIITIFGVIFTIWRMFKAIQTIVPSRETLNIIENKNSDARIIFFIYLLSFFMSHNSLEIFASFIIILLIITVIYINTSLFNINPLIEIVFGYNIYEVTFGKSMVYLLSRSRLQLGNNDLEILKLDANIYMESNIKN